MKHVNKVEIVKKKKKKIAVKLLFKKRIKQSLATSKYMIVTTNNVSFLHDTLE